MLKTLQNVSPVAVIALINAVRITKDNLMNVGAESLEFRREHPDANPFITLITRGCEQGDDDPDESFAIWQRLAAVSRLIREDGAPGWTMRTEPDGGTWLEDTVYAAAAVHPRIQGGAEWGFDRESFLERVGTGGAKTTA